MNLKLHVFEVASRKQMVEEARYRLASARQLARIWSATLPEANRRDLAAVFTREAILAYCALDKPGARLSEPFSVPGGSLDASTKKLALAIGCDATILPFSEALHWLTGLYTTLLDARERSAMGAFYTPPALANRLLALATEQGIDWQTARILDPASGGGAFLLAIVDRLCEAMCGYAPAYILDQLEKRLAGFELDPYAAWFGQAALELRLADVAAAAGRPVPTLVRVTNTLDEEPTAEFDLVVGNPPYGRVSLSPELRQRYKRSLYGHANLYGVFTDIAIRWARKGGVIAYLTPASFLGGHYYMALRKLLAAEAPPTAIDFVQARSGVFEDVLQETLLAVYRKNGKIGRVQVHYVELTDERDAHIVRNGTIGLPASTSAPWLAPRGPEHSPLIKVAEKMTSRLADWGYRVSTGPLVWNRFKSQLRERSSRDARPLIWAEAVTTDGQFVFRAQKKNHAPYFIMTPKDGWLLVKESCVLVQRTTAKEQHRRLIAAELPAAFIEQHDGVIVENHLNMVRPIGRPSISPATLAAVLNSQVVDQLFRCMSGSVAVSAFELEALPLPSPAAMKALDKLVRVGCTREDFESKLAALYGQG